MNAYTFTPRYSLVASIFILALIVSACSGLLPERPNVPPAQAYQACSVGAPEAVIVDGRRWNCADLVSAPPVSPAATSPVPGPVATTSAPGPTAEAPISVAATVGPTTTLTCDGNTIQVPENGQVFPATTWVNNQPKHNSCYDVVYDPDQSGVSYLPAKGWWYQPLLPGPAREYHEVALILQAGTYKFVGPECVAYHNFDGQHGLKAGNVLVNRQNVEELTVPKTEGAPGNESWVFVVCNESDASGFSFALR